MQKRYYILCNPKNRSIAFVLAFALASLFVLHAAVSHEHSEHVFGSSLQAATHGEEKKLVFLPPLLDPSVPLFIVLGCLMSALGLRVKNFEDFDPFRYAIRRGMLQRRTFG